MKQSPWHLSFVYTSKVSLLVRTALIGKQTVPLKFNNSEFDTIPSYAVQTQSFSTNYFLLVFSDYLEHSWKYGGSMSDFNSQKVVDAKQWQFNAAYDGVCV